MPDLRVYGASDDLLEVAGAVTDEFGCWNRPIWLKVLDPETGAGLIIRGEYEPPGVWTLGVSQLDEDAPLPWPVTIEQSAEVGYSVELRIDVPDGVTVQEFGQ